ncbi:hypothetical protein HDU67_006464, partial [Dinochytrium kinnereticum]
QAPPGPQIVENVNSTRTEYVPQIKIMRRDPKSKSGNQGQSSSSSSTSSPTATSKGLSGRPSSPGTSSSASGPRTLAEREAEYRAARMRIFGKEEPEPEKEAGGSASPGEVSSGTAPSVRPSRTSTPPIRNNNNNNNSSNSNNTNNMVDNNPRIWTPTNQVNPTASGPDRGYGLSRQPIPPPTNHHPSIGWAGVMSSSNQSMLGPGRNGMHPLPYGGQLGPTSAPFVGIPAQTLGTGMLMSYGVDPTAMGMRPNNANQHPMRYPSSTTTPTTHHPSLSHQHHHHHPHHLNRFSFPDYPGYPGPISSPNQVSSSSSMHKNGGMIPVASASSYRGGGGMPTPLGSAGGDFSNQPYLMNDVGGGGGATHLYPSSSSVHAVHVPGGGGFVMYDGAAAQGYPPNVGFVAYDHGGNQAGGGGGGGVIGQRSLGDASFVGQSSEFPAGFRGYESRPEAIGVRPPHRG